MNADQSAAIDDALLGQVMAQLTRQNPQQAGVADQQSGHRAASSDPAASNSFDLASPNLEKDLARLVLSLVEFVRRLLENQALRRMERGSLSDVEIERLGDGLMRAENQIHLIARQFGFEPHELNLDLGPLGRLMPGSPPNNS